ncbi:hypothetical protein ABZ897_51120 [Nonomuraea sp. NPDC046802]|uniref:hypothetical protein n=1 Tax=Nonomuraea sp. NPDC046802 TaxID=3154919 RepID=UPI0033C93275
MNPEASLAAVLITAVLQDGQPRTRTELIEAAYPVSPIDGALLDMIWSHLTEALPGMVRDGELVEVVLDGPGDAFGEVWYTLPIRRSSRHN